MLDSIAYCGPAVTPEDFWSRWNGDPLLIAMFVVLAVAVALGRAANVRAGWGAIAAFVGGRVGRGDLVLSAEKSVYGVWAMLSVTSLAIIAKAACTQCSARLLSSRATRSLLCRRAASSNMIECASSRSTVIG